MFFARSVLLAAGNILAWSVMVPAASAQGERPAATVLVTQRTGVDEGTGAAFDRTLRARLDALEVVAVGGAVALDLEQIQLALGCLGETTACLSQVATETEAVIVVVPSLAQAGDTLLATILVFDARDGSLRRTTREAEGRGATETLLGAVEGMLREAFGLPAVEQITASEVGDPPTPVTPPARPGLSPAPIVVLSVGVLSLLGGAIAGGLYFADASAYAQPITTAEQRDALDAIRERGNAEGLAATILSIGGGVLAAGGLVWLLLGGREDFSSPLAVTPMFSPDGAQIVLSGRFAEGF